MIDPFSAIVITAVALAGTLVGTVIGRRQHSKPPPPDLVEKARRLGLDLEYANHKISALKDGWDKAEQARDTYRKIAESHKVKYLPPEGHTQRVKEWEGRAYIESPNDVFDLLHADLSQFGTDIIEVTYSVEGIGDVWDYADVDWPDDENLSGHANGIARQIRASLVGAKKNTNKGPVWISNDPLRIIISVARIVPATNLKYPEVQVVEVAVIEERVEVQTIEKKVPIFHTLEGPTKGQSALLSPSQEDQIILIRAVLEAEGVTKYKP